MTATPPSKVLVIDDDRLYQASLVQLLEDAGYEAYTAVDGLSGLERTREVLPDVVLCDLVMPRMDGQAYCQAIKSDAELKPTYVALLSARGNCRDRIKGLDAGADDFVVKPVDPDELLARVRSGVRVRRLQHELAQAQRSKALLEIAATLGHEINNPLTALFGHLELLLQYLGQGNERGMKHHVRQAGEVASRIAEVGHRLMALREPRTTNYGDGVEMLDLQRSVYAGHPDLAGAKKP